MSSIQKLIAQLNEEDELWEKEAEKHFENQHHKYKQMVERLTDFKGKAEKCIDDITKGLDNLISHQHTIEKALKETDNLFGLPIPPEQQENTINLVNKMTKFMNNTELITSPNPVSPEQIEKDVASYTECVAQELKDCKNDLHAVKALCHQTQLLHFLTAKSTGQKEIQAVEESQYKLHTITENE